MSQDDTLVFLRDAARRQCSADVVRELHKLTIKHPSDWIGILVQEQATWGDDGAFVMKHVVIRDGGLVTFERRDRGTS
jgi:hypothetical protein